MNKNRRIVILGSGGHAKVAIDVCVASGREVAGLLDTDDRTGKEVLGVRVLGTFEMLKDTAFVDEHQFLTGIGDQMLKREWNLLLDSEGASLATIIHPSCVVSDYAVIGDGTLLAPGVIVNAGTRIGRFCILNTGCSVDHDCYLEDGCQICPGARLAGRIRCGIDAFIGTGAILLPDIAIGDHATVGAGATVTHDVAAGTTVVGCPAKPIADHSTSL